MELEQLQQENAKLTERLNNAAKFFREQKTQIESLTKENEDLKNQINRTQQEEIISTEDWNKLVNEKENLNKQCNEYELKLQKLESDIDSKDKAYKVLQDTYNEVFTENKQLKDQINSCEFNAECDANNAEKLQKQITEMTATINTQNEEIKKLTVARNNLIKKSQEFDNVIKGYEKSLKDAQDKSDTVIKEQTQELNELKNFVSIKEDENNNLKNEIKNINKLYENLENEKCAFENDLINLEEKYKALKEEAEANSNLSYKYTNLYNDFEKYHKFIESIVAESQKLINKPVEPKQQQQQQQQNINQNKFVKDALITI